jgi:hypothetical protein
MHILRLLFAAFKSPQQEKLMAPRALDSRRRGNSEPPSTAVLLIFRPPDDPPQK